jgi:hypothetical protein
MERSFAQGHARLAETEKHLLNFREYERELKRALFIFGMSPCLVRRLGGLGPIPFIDLAASRDRSRAGTTGMRSRTRWMGPGWGSRREVLERDLAYLWN